MDEEIDLLLTALQRSGPAITAQEHQELQEMVNKIRKPGGGFDVPDGAESRKSASIQYGSPRNGMAEVAS